MFDSISFLRIIKSGFVNFSRNLWLSTAATMIMTITLVIFSILFLLFLVTNYSIKTVENRVDISVYFKTGLNGEKINEIKAEIEANPKVKEVKYISAEEVFANFKERHLTNDSIQQSLNMLTENPLPSTLNVKAYALEDFPSIAEFLQNPNYTAFIEKINFEDNKNVIERLNRLLKIIISFGLGLAITFSVIAVLVIFNTITLTIYNRKEEVEIMRLVGATNWYIRGPFLVESILYACLATLITTGIFFPIFSQLLPKVGIFVNPEFNSFNGHIFSFWFLSLILLVISLILAVFSTFLAIRKYLKI